MKNNELSTKHNDDILSSLKSYILLRYKKEGLKTLSISSSSRGEYKTLVAISLAQEFAQANIKTILIDLDLEQPGIAVKLNLNKSNGITDVAGNVSSLKDSIIKYDKNLDILLTGTKIKYVDEFLNSDILANTINNISKDYDIIIINNSPITSIDDCIGISNYSYSMLLCVGKNLVSKADLKNVREYINQSEINLLGIIMTNVDTNKVVEKPINEIKNVVFYNGLEDLGKKPKQKKKTLKQAKEEKRETILKTITKSKVNNTPKLETKKEETKKVVKTTNKSVSKPVVKKEVAKKDVKKEKPSPTKKVTKVTKVKQPIKKVETKQIVNKKPVKEVVAPTVKKDNKPVLNEKDRIRAALAKQKTLNK